MSLPSAPKYLFAAILLLCGLSVHAFTPTGVAPAFFGPNAFPIPDMTDGRTRSTLDVELAGDGYFGFKGDKTADVFARVCVPLFTRWANVTVWMPVYEWYTQPAVTGEGLPVSGSGAGDVYITTDVQVLHNDWFKSGNTAYIPQMTVRLGMKTASGGQFERRRHYDCPAYFFDTSLGESFQLGSVELRAAGSIGFLCWQTADARQNDAVMYGLQLAAKHEYASLQATWGGYVGWERYGDAPMSVKLRAAGHIQAFEPYVQYQYGIKDFPFHQVRAGLVWHVNVLKR